MSFLDQFEVSDDDLKNGVKYDLGDDHFIWLRPMDATNLEWAKALEHASRPYLKLMQKGKMPLEKDRDINMKVFCKKIVVKWQGSEFPEFSADACYELFKAKPKLYFLCRDLATTDISYQTEVLDDAAGKSST